MLTTYSKKEPLEILSEKKSDDESVNCHWTYPGLAGKPGTRAVTLESWSELSVNINTVLTSRLPITDPKKINYKRRSTGEVKVKKIAAGEEGNYRMERVPPKADWQPSQIPGWGYKRQRIPGDGKTMLDIDLCYVCAFVYSFLPMNACEHSTI